LYKTVQPSRRSGAWRLTERSGTVAAALSFVFPGLGHAYLRRPRAALILAVPVLVLIGALALMVVLDGMTRTGAKLLNPTIALGAAILVLALGTWWIWGIVGAWRSGRHTGASAAVVPLILVALIVSGTLYGADWMYRLSVADRSFGSGPDPTLGETPTPSPIDSGIAQVPTASSQPTGGPTSTPDETLEPTEPPATIEPGPSPSFDITTIDAQDDGWLNVLLLGLDTRCAGGLVTGANTDTMMVVSANAATGEVQMFSFPRDLVGFPLYLGGTMPGYWKLNTFAGYTKQHPETFPDPGQPALAYEIGYLLGIPIDYYASINICGFPQLIDEVGGVTVCNSKIIDDPGYHWTDGRLGFHLDPGSYHFDGETALAYARSRHGSSDFARAKRQQQLLGAIRSAILAPGNLARLPEIVATVGGIVHTNFPPDRIDQLLALANQVQDDPAGQYVFQPPLWAEHPPITETNGRSVQILKLDAVAALSIQIFGDKSLYEVGGVVPSTSPTDLPTPSPEPSDGTNPC
jgi:cell envelope-related function transcriptional attenuator common domain